MRTTRISFALLVLLISIAATSQSTEKLSGRVVVLDDDENKEGLPGANVIWAGTTTGTTTDLDGRFELDRLPDAEVLLVSFTGYRTDTIVAPQDGVEIVMRSGVALESVDVISREQSTSIELLNPLNVQTMDSRELRKAACCNLSESFETNASVDASFTDAITGTRQIKMLGLSGRYSQILKDNIPEVRGLSTVYGLGYIPGDWINDIHISKGAGSVTSGYESMTGEINVALKDPEMEEKAHFNIYGNQGGRMEFNALTKAKVSDTWSTIVLGHAELNQTEIDRNNDRFMDNPQKQDFVLRNQWKFRAKEHWEGQYSVDYLEQHQESGQLSSAAESDELWRMHLDARRIAAQAKTGYVFDDFWGSSFGSQFSYVDYDMELGAGFQDYSGRQQTFRGNLLYATNLGCKTRGLTVGASYLWENYTQSLDSLPMNREEQVMGAYAEFTWNPNDRLSTIIGARVDEHNLFGTMFSPRFHLRYSLSESLSAKLAAGRGYRTANPVTDNIGLLASNRSWNIQAPLVQESAWNLGVNLTYKFRLDYRDASLALDAYSTRFDEMAVVDQELPQLVQVYTLQGESFANTAQAEFAWEMMRRTDVRIAYRYTDARTDYLQGRLVQPFTPEHRGFLNLGYSTKEKKNGQQWKVDGTLQYIGEQRLPYNSLPISTSDDHAFSPAFFQVHGQVTYVAKKGLEVYLGIENASDYRQNDPIYFAQDPSNEAFDASQIWGPVFGRMSYLGLRWTLY